MHFFWLNFQDAFKSHDKSHDDKSHDDKSHDDKSHDEKSKFGPPRP